MNNNSSLNLMSNLSRKSGIKKKIKSLLCLYITMEPKQQEKKLNKNRIFVETLLFFYNKNNL